VRLVVPPADDPAARAARVRLDAALPADTRAIDALQELDSLQDVLEQERQARRLAEAQQLRIVTDFRTMHRQALDLAQRLDYAYLETITALARAVEARDDYTGGHIERVRRYSLQVGESLGLTQEQLRHLEFGAVLHDVGKIGVPDGVLGKPGPLEQNEWQVMRTHPEIGRRVLQGIAFLEPTVEAVASHHERWDGRGYPNGLSGDQIPLAGRIVGVVDAYDAMVTDRPYRRGLPLSVAISEIEKGRGTQFDPDIALVFLLSGQRLA
jgi:HD-GYP domain-containing protein (c-di-GMP phosphodiesterase class II)